jgi:hypothetical protein
MRFASSLDHAEYRNRRGSPRRRDLMSTLKKTVGLVAIAFALSLSAACVDAGPGTNPGDSDNAAAQTAGFWVPDGKCIPWGVREVNIEDVFEHAEKNDQGGYNIRLLPSDQECPIDEYWAEIGLTLRINDPNGLLKGAYVQVFAWGSVYSSSVTTESGRVLGTYPHFVLPDGLDASDGQPSITFKLNGSAAALMFMVDWL